MDSLFTYLIVGLLSSVLPLIIVYCYLHNDSKYFDSIKYYPILYALFNMVLLYSIEQFYPDMNMFVVGALAGVLLTSYDRFVTRIPAMIGMKDPSLYHLYMIPVWSLWYGIVVKNVF